MSGIAAAARAGQRDQLRRLSVLIAIACVDMLGVGIVFPQIPLYGITLGATPEMIGWVIAAFSIAQLLSSPLWGRISDHYGRRPALLAGLLAEAAAFVIFGLANTVWLLFLSRLIQGAGGGTTGVIQAYVSDTVKAGDRTRALGWLSAATNFGVMLGPVLGSLAFHLGHQVPGLIAAALCLINAGFAWKWLPESRPPLAPGAPPRPRKPVWHAALQVVRHPGTTVSRLIWIYAAGMLGFTAMGSILAIYLNDVFGVTEENIGYVFMYLGALSVVMRLLFLGPIVQRLGEPGTMRAGTILLTLGLLAYPLAHSWWTLAPIMALVPIGTALLFPATTALMSHATEQSEVGLTLGVAQAFAGLSRVIAPLLATAALQRVSTPAPFLLAGGIVALVGVLAFRLEVGHLREAESAAPEKPA